MSAVTRIEWATRSWSPIIGCDRVSPGCTNCYAIRTAHRLAHNPHPRVAASAAGTTARIDGRLDWTGQVNQLPDRLTDPFEWRKPERVFVNSQSDLFHSTIPIEFVAQVFAVMAATPRHTYQVLSKRPGRMRSLLSDPTFRLAVVEQVQRMDRDPIFVWPLRNLWLGTSVENQQWADIRIPALLDTPAEVHWVSLEPLLGPVDLTDIDNVNVLDPADMGRENGLFWEPGPLLDWVVVGGESGPGARLMQLQWALDIQRQCSKYPAAYFFKQTGTVLARELGLKGKGDDPEQWPEPWPQQYPG